MSYKMNESPCYHHSGQEIKFASTSEAIPCVFQPTGFLLIPYFSLQFICRVRSTRVTCIFASRPVLPIANTRPSSGCSSTHGICCKVDPMRQILIRLRLSSFGGTRGDGAFLQQKAFDVWVSLFCDVSSH